MRHSWSKGYLFYCPEVAEFMPEGMSLNYFHSPCPSVGRLARDETPFSRVISRDSREEEFLTTELIHFTGDLYDVNVIEDDPIPTLITSLEGYVDEAIAGFIFSLVAGWPDSLTVDTLLYGDTDECEDIRQASCCVLRRDLEIFKKTNRSANFIGERSHDGVLLPEVNAVGSIALLTPVEGKRTAPFGPNPVKPGLCSGARVQWDIHDLFDSKDDEDVAPSGLDAQRSGSGRFSDVKDAIIMFGFDIYRNASKKWKLIHEKLLPTPPKPHIKDRHATAVRYNLDKGKQEKRLYSNAGHCSSPPAKEKNVGGRSHQIQPQLQPVVRTPQPAARTRTPSQIRPLTIVGRQRKPQSTDLATRSSPDAAATYQQIALDIVCLDSVVAEDQLKEKGERRRRQKRRLARKKLRDLGRKEAMEEGGVFGRVKGKRGGEQIVCFI
ncbi:hypothetical protein AKJ16_DCAP22469, partial [Drosera capensis]